jgi:TATA-binding protein-associated factor Taf7
VVVVVEEEEEEEEEEVEEEEEAAEEKQEEEGAGTIILVKFSGREEEEEVEEEAGVPSPGKYLNQECAGMEGGRASRRREAKVPIAPPAVFASSEGARDCFPLVL